MTQLRKVLASIPQKLNELFAERMRDEKFQKLVVKEARESHPDESDMSDDEMLEEAFDRTYVAWMKDFEKRGKFEDDDLILYRGISVDSPGDINFKKMGESWTWDKSKAANYSAKNTKKPLLIIKARVPLSAVDFKQTLKKIVWPGYSFDESEREFHLKRGASIEVLELLDKKSDNVLEKPTSATI